MESNEEAREMRPKLHRGKSVSLHNAEYMNNMHTWFRLPPGAIYNTRNHSFRVHGITSSKVNVVRLDWLKLSQIILDLEIAHFNMYVVYFYILYDLTFWRDCATRPIYPYVICDSVYRGDRGYL